MSDPHEEPKEEIAAPGGSEAAPAAPATTTPWRGIALGLAGILLLAVALVGTAPFWAMSLPWASPPSRPPPDPRIDRLEAALQRTQQGAGKMSEALQGIDRRLAALEHRPQEATADGTEFRRQLAISSEVIADLKKRLDAYDYKHERLAADVGDLAQMLTDEGRRLDTIDKALQTKTTDTTDTAIVLVLLQIRDALEIGRPFSAEYDALVALAHPHPEIEAAAMPLAEAAKSGVAGRAMLAGRLPELRAAIAASQAATKEGENAAPAANWADDALSRLRSLVTIRRIGSPEAPAGAPSGAAAAPIDVAARALAGGDLEAAVAALDGLAGPAAEAARPWLRMAKQRLAVEAALHRIEALLAVRLGGAGNAAAVPGSAR